MKRALALVLTHAALVIGATAASAAPGEDAAARNPSVDSFPTPMVAPLTKMGLALAGISALSGGLGAVVEAQATGPRRRRREHPDPRESQPLQPSPDLAPGRRRAPPARRHGRRRSDLPRDLTETELFSGKLDRHLPRAESTPEPDFLEKIGKFEGLDA